MTVLDMCFGREKRGEGRNILVNIYEIDVNLIVVFISILLNNKN